MEQGLNVMNLEGLLVDIYPMFQFMTINVSLILIN